MSSSAQSSLANQLALAQATYRYCNNKFDDFFKIIKNKIHWLETVLPTLAVDKAMIPDRVITMMIVLLSHCVDSIRLQQTPNSDVGSSSSEGRLTEEEFIKECVTKEIVYAAADIFMTLIYHDSNYSFYKDCIKTLLSGDRELHVQAKVALLSTKEIRPLVILQHALSLTGEFASHSDADTDTIDSLLQSYFSKEPAKPKKYKADDSYSHMPDVYRFVRGDKQFIDYDPAEASEEELDKEDSHGRTAVHWAAIKKSATFFNRVNDDIIEESLLTLEDRNGLTPIHYIAMNNSDSNVEFLQRVWTYYQDEMMETGYNKFHRAPWTLLHTVLYAGNLHAIQLIQNSFLDDLLSDLNDWLNHQNDNTRIAAWKRGDFYKRESVGNPRIVLLTLFEALMKGDKLDAEDKLKIFVEYHQFFFKYLNSELKTYLLEASSAYESRKILSYLIETYQQDVSNKKISHYRYKLAEIILKNGSVEELYSMVNTYPDIWDIVFNHKFGETSLLHSAVKNATTLQGVEWLGIILPKVCDFSVTDYRGQTPLHIAATMGNYEAVKVLLFHMSEESDIYDMPDSAGNTALSIAKQRKHFLKQQLTARQEGDVEFNEEEMREIDKLRAALYECAQVVTLLQSRSNHAVVSVKTSHEEFCRAKLLPNIYHQANVPYDDDSPIDWQGFSVNEMHVDDILQQDREGKSALHWAFIRGHLDLAIILCRILHENGQSEQVYELRDKEGLSPMDYASMTVTPCHARLLLCTEKEGYAGSKYLRTFMLATMKSYIMDNEFGEIVRMFQPCLSYESVLELLVYAINSKRFNNAYCLWKEINHFSAPINLLSILLMVGFTHKDSHANLFMMFLITNNSGLLSNRHQNQYPLTYAVSSNNMELAIFLIQQVGLQHKQSTDEEKKSLLSDSAAREFLSACSEFKEKNKTKKNDHYKKVLPEIIQFFPTLRENAQYYYSNSPRLSSSPTASLYGRSHVTLAARKNGFTHNVNINTSRVDSRTP